MYELQRPENAQLIAMLEEFADNVHAIRIVSIFPIQLDVS